jgi:hypothetical protein
MVFDAIFPRYFGTLVQAAEVPCFLSSIPLLAAIRQVCVFVCACLFSFSPQHWADQPAVTTPLLKFFDELVNNKNARIVFDNISPNGIILFKEASRILLAYGTRLLGSPLPPPQDLYPARYKGMAIALRVLTNALDGNYVNFGVFTLYGDKVGHLR